MEKMTVGTNRFPVIVTYAIAVVCLLAGLFLPFTAKGFGGVDDMLILQLPAAFGTLIGLDMTPAFAYSGNFTLFGAISGNVNLYAIIILLYFAITVIALLGLIAVCAAKKRTAFKFATTIEAIAAAILGFFFVCELINASLGQLDYWKINMLIALGGTLLMLAVQAIIYRRGSGVIKLVLFLISLVGIVAMFGFAFDAVFAKNYASFVDQFGFSAGIASEIDMADILVGMFLAPSGMFTVYDTVRTSTLTVMVFLFGVLALVNCLLDMLGMAKATKKWTLTANLVRYLIAVLIFVDLLFLIPLNGHTYGFALIAIGVLAFVSLIINIVRCFNYRRVERAKAAEAEEVADSDEVTDSVLTESTESVEAGVAETKSNKAKSLKVKSLKTKNGEPAEGGSKISDDMYISDTMSIGDAADEDAENNEAYVYRVGPVYQGPLDEFIKTLTNAERVEFAKTFIERKNENLDKIPVYNIGENNTEFFKTVFVYYGTVRPLVSDGLMAKLYKQVKD